MCGSDRTVSAKKNIIVSFGLKAISIIISLQVVPITINYINSTQYGIWLTLSSIIAWLSYFDLGFAHGFRNRFAEAKANDDHELARKYVSTTYAILAILFTCVFVLVSIINYFLDWSMILNVNTGMKVELQMVFQILAFFFCINFVANVLGTMLTADQKPALSSFIQTVGQLFAFLTIYILTKTIEGNLVILALAFSGIPCICLIIASFILFSGKRYKGYSPNIRYVQLSLVKNILGLGVQFFFITTSMFFIFQFINVIISRNLGPESVTQYNIAYKYFNVLAMMTMIILTPFWSAFTDAYTKKDFIWMKKTQYNLERMWLICLPIAIVMVICSTQIYQWWVGNSVTIPFSLSIIIAVYVICQILGNLYMFLINGTGKVRLQLIIYFSFAIISLPLMNYSCDRYGIQGILFVPIVVFLCQAIIGKIQLSKIVNNCATGIWNK